MTHYHITVNGIPHCEAPVYQLMKARGLTAHQVCDAACACGYGDKRLQADIDASKLRVALPDADIQVAEGECHEDPWWSTEDGRCAIAHEEEYRESLYRD